MRLIVSLLVLVALAGCSLLERARSNFWELERGPSGLAPDPAITRDAVIQVYAARTVGWRGFFAVHTWISVKPRDAAAYTRYEVIGWGVGGGAPAVRVNRSGADNYWFGDRPELLVDVRGEAAEPLIARVEAAVASYPYPTSYRTWPGPNSNTFIAWIGRAVPELRLKLPPTAIGKDFLPGSVAGPTPSGTGVQVSLFGLSGFAVGWDEGLEVNILTLNFGFEVTPPAIKLPLVGRLGFPGSGGEAGAAQGGADGAVGGVARPRGARALPRCGWAPSGRDAAECLGRERVASTPPTTPSAPPEPRPASRLGTDTHVNSALGSARDLLHFSRTRWRARGAAQAGAGYTQGLGG